MKGVPGRFGVRYVALGLACGAVALAQPAENSPQQGQNASTRPQYPSLDLKFGGGTLAEYVAAIRKAAGDVNILIATPEARAIPVPEVELKSVSLGSALELLAEDVRTKSGDELRVYVDHFGPQSADARPVFRIRVEPKSRPGPSGVHVWTLSGLLSDELSPEAVLTAVETAVGLLGDQFAPAEIRFHEATGLLIVSGRHEQLQAVDRVIDRLQEANARAVKVADEAGLEYLKQTQQGLRDLFEFGAEQEGLGKKLHEAEHARVQLEDQLARKKREVEKLREQLRRAEGRIKELERRSGGRTEE